GRGSTERLVELRCSINAACRKMPPAAVEGHSQVGIALEGHALDQTCRVIELALVDAEECRSACTYGIENVCATLANRARRSQIGDGACRTLAIGRNRRVRAMHRGAVRLESRTAQTRPPPLASANGSPSRTEPSLK